MKVFNLFYTLEEKFKHIFLLNLSTRKDRRETMIKQLRHFGLLESYTQDELDIRTTVPFKKYNSLMMHVLNQNKLGRLTKPNEYDCTHNHYSMVRQAYDQGYEYCLIMEDDIRFLNDNETWAKYLENIPKDFDILQFGGFTADSNIKKYLLNYENDVKDKIFFKHWIKHADVPVWNASMYALSRKGMEYYLEFIDKFLWVADGPLYSAARDRQDLNTYICSIPLVIQEDKNIEQSDIRDKQNDDIDYNTQNMYECNINRTMYWHMD